MTQSLVINGKEYLQSNLLASRFGYTSDYIGKLAREEKILGTQVGRQWFIEPESLAIFLAQAEITKKLRQEELRLQRKVERQLHQEKLEADKKVAFYPEIVAFAQTAAVVCCGFMLGGLWWIAAQEGLGIQELAIGASESTSFIVGSVAVSPFEYSFSAKDLSAASAESVAPSTRGTARTEQLVFTSLPEFPMREQLATSTSTSEQASSAVIQRFSDEVQVVKTDDGSEVIIPVFREGAVAQQFLLVPVNASNQ